MYQIYLNLPEQLWKRDVIERPRLRSQLPEYISLKYQRTLFRDWLHNLRLRRLPINFILGLASPLKLDLA